MQGARAQFSLLTGAGGVSGLAYNLQNKHLRAYVSSCLFMVPWEGMNAHVLVVEEAGQPLVQLGDDIASRDVHDAVCAVSERSPEPVHDIRPRLLATCKSGAALIRNGVLPSTAISHHGPEASIW